MTTSRGTLQSPVQPSNESKSNGSDTESLGSEQHPMVTTPTSRRHLSVSISQSQALITLRRQGFLWFSQIFSVWFVRKCLLRIRIFLCNLSNGSLSSSHCLRFFFNCFLCLFSSAILRIGHGMQWFLAVAGAKSRHGDFFGAFHWKIGARQVFE